MSSDQTRWHKILGEPFAIFWSLHSLHTDPSDPEVGNEVMETLKSRKKLNRYLLFSVADKLSELIAWASQGQEFTRVHYLLSYHKKYGFQSGAERKINHASDFVFLTSILVLVYIGDLFYLCTKKRKSFVPVCKKLREFHANLCVHSGDTGSTFYEVEPKYSTRRKKRTQKNLADHIAVIRALARMVIADCSSIDSRSFTFMFKLMDVVTYYADKTDLQYQFMLPRSIPLMDIGKMYGVITCDIYANMYIEEDNGIIKEVISQKNKLLNAVRGPEEPDTSMAYSMLIDPCFSDKKTLFVHRRPIPCERNVVILNRQFGRVSIRNIPIWVVNIRGHDIHFPVMMGTVHNCGIGSSKRRSQVITDYDLSLEVSILDMSNVLKELCLKFGLPNSVVLMYVVPHLLSSKFSNCTDEILSAFRNCMAL